MKTVGDIYRLAALALIEVAVHGDQAKSIIVANEAVSLLRLVADANGKSDHAEVPLDAPIPGYAETSVTKFVELVRRCAPEVKVDV